MQNNDAIKLNPQRARLRMELDILLNDNEGILTNYEKIIDLLNKKGASKNAAQFIISFF